MKKFFQKLFGILFPTNVTCVVCGREVFDGERLCARCRAAMPYLPSAVCVKCGRKTPGGGVCENCKAHAPKFDYARSVCSFVAPAQTVLHALKFGGKKYLTEYMIEELAALCRREGICADVAVGIPMSRRELRRRGFNQSELLAAGVAEKLAIAFCRPLMKVRDTKRQARLDGNARKKNLEGAFRVADKAAVKGKRVLIVDDVMTTGTTASEVADRLKRAGAKTVVSVTYCSVDEENPFSTNKTAKIARTAQNSFTNR